VLEIKGRARQKTAILPSLERVSVPSHITFVQAATSVSGEPESPRVSESKHIGCTRDESPARWRAG
jgi:hypothetical protein